MNFKNKAWVGTVFANGPGDLGSIPGRVIPKTFWSPSTTVSNFIYLLIITQNIRTIAFISIVRYTTLLCSQLTKSTPVD